MNINKKMKIDKVFISLQYLLPVALRKTEVESVIPWSEKEYQWLKNMKPANISQSL